MKKYLLVFSMLLGCTAVSMNAVAQKDKGASTPSNNTYVSASAVLTKTHTVEELKALGKTELVQIYMERVSILTEITPYIALKSKPGATLKQMGIPESPQNTEHLNKEAKNKATYLASVKETLDDITFYADKDNIIWSILFLEETITKAEGK